MLDFRLNVTFTNVQVIARFAHPDAVNFIRNKATLACNEFLLSSTQGALMTAATIKVWWAIFYLSSGSGVGDHFVRETGIPVFASLQQCKLGLEAYEAGLKAAYSHSIAPDFSMSQRFCKEERR